MTSAPRYAIYFVPAPDRPLYRFGRAALGYDCYTGEELAHHDCEKLPADEWSALTREPRTYGFHATLKAPFRLPPATDEGEIVDALTAFAAVPRAIPVIEPCVRLLGPFIAIMPRAPCAALDDLAARCVIEFDRFRAPLTAPERERRLAGGLGAAEAANLEHWGYPYVFGAFRFHMTLTGPLAPERRDSALALLQGAFTRECGESAIAVDRVALLRQDDPQARFRVLAHAGLRPLHAADWRTPREPHL
jgi:putative phosphonate metabolism protein